MEFLLHLPNTIPFPTSISSSTRFHKFKFFPFNRHNKYPTPLNCKRKAFEINSSIYDNNNDTNSSSSSSRDGLIEGNLNSGIWGEENEFVEVFGIGSRRDAVLDFCMDSPSLSTSLRFWNILMKDSAEVQLQQRYPIQAIPRRKADASQSARPGSKAVILVASTGYSFDHITAIDILTDVKARNGLVVAIILKPFSFEGQRRQEEVKDLLSNLQRHATFCIVVDTDALLEEDMVTLDEAINNSNKAVLMALNAISSLISEKHIKLLNVTDSSTTELKVPELRKILESYKVGKIGFGSSHNINTSILQAYACPFLGVGVQDLDGVIVCILASSNVSDCSDVHKIAHTFRPTGFKGQLILSVIHNPRVEPDLIITTVMNFSYGGQNSSEKSGIFSRLARHFPFFFNIMKKQRMQTQNSQDNSCTEIDALNAQDTPDNSTVNETVENIGSYSDLLETLLSNGSEEISPLRIAESSSEQSEAEFFEAGSHASTDMLNSEGNRGIPAFNRELLTRQNLGPGYKISQKSVQDGSDNREITAVRANVSVFKLPVGVKHPEQLKDFPASSPKDQPERIMGDDKKARSLATADMARTKAAGSGLEVVADFHNNASALEKKISTNSSRRQGVLSTRAASMLEAERNSEKKLSRNVEMKYRGGSYKGQIEGGLPEGKGRLTLSDGSVYDGMWRYGKRSGVGTFFYSNGDFFQGSWRDDVMHGKGWLYFHTGDRWFVNFWKGKANGEGRFYSKLGDVFFGHFKDGWRHGHFLHVSVDGMRCHEVWDEGVLVSRTQLEDSAD